METEKDYFIFPNETPTFTPVSEPVSTSMWNRHLRLNMTNASLSQPNPNIQVYLQNSNTFTVKKTGAP